MSGISRQSENPRGIPDRRGVMSGIHLEFSFPVILNMFMYPERCPLALSMYVLMHLDP